MSDRVHAHAPNPDPSAADIPHVVDLQAVVDILSRFYPHLATDEIKTKLVQVMQGHGRLVFLPSDPPPSGG